MILFKKNFFDKKNINKINKDINSILIQFSKKNKNKKKSNSELFEECTNISIKLRQNVYKTFSKLFTINSLLNEKKVQKILSKKGFKNTVLASYSIVVMEPKIKKFLFPFHQDLKTRHSKKSISMWIPLNDNLNNMGGLELIKNSEKFGPIPHFINQKGLTEIKNFYMKKMRKMKRIKITKYKRGDVLFFSPYTVHKSIPNFRSKESRWSLIAQFDDLTNPYHLRKSTFPFKIEKYSTQSTNESFRTKR